MMRELIELQTQNGCESCKSTPISFQKKTNNLEGIMMIPSDLNILNNVRSRLEEICKQLELEDDQVSELVLIGDELVSNSLLEAHKQNSKEDVILYYKVSEHCFSMNVMDYCGGFIPPCFYETSLNKDLNSYLEDALFYQTCNAVKNYKKEKSVLFHRLGKGLQLVKTFASSFNILFYNVTGELSEEKDCNTLGSIIKIRYSL